MIRFLLFVLLALDSLGEDDASGKDLVMEFPFASVCVDVDQGRMHLQSLLDLLISTSVQVQV